MADTCIKLVGQAGLPAYEMVAFLGLFMALFLAVWAVGRGQGGVLRPHRVNWQLLRACLDMANNVCVVVALRHLSLTLFYILIFTAPITISLLSAVVLREGLPWRRAVAIGVGFAGVLVAVNPLGNAREGDLVGYGACLVCVACFSGHRVWSRVLTRTETPESLAFFSGLVTSAMGFALMLATGAAGTQAGQLSGPVLAGLCGMGLFCALGTLCFYIAVKHTSAANVSQYHYTQLITGTVVTYAIWGTRPGWWVVGGAGLIFGSGVYIAMGARGAVVPLTEGG